MPTISVPLKSFGSVLRKRIRGDLKRLDNAAREAVQRAEAKLVAETDRRGLVHMGHFRESWKHGRIAGRRGWMVYNDAPYAGVIEHGRRPNRPGPPVEPILEWVRRKLVANGQVEAKDAKSVAFVIRRSIHRNGTKPRKLMLLARLGMRRWMSQAARRHLNLR